MDIATRRPSAPAYLAGLIVGLGIVINPLTVGYFDVERTFDSFVWRSSIVAAQIGFVALGVIVWRRRPTRSPEIALSLTVLLLMLAVAECISVATGVFARYYSDRQRMFHSFLQPDPELGFRPKPDLEAFDLAWMRFEVHGSYDTDRYGFRNPGQDYDAARVFFVGDSFAFGAWMPREDTFFAIVASELSTSVVSLAAGGYGFYQYRVLVAQFLERYSPEVVALCVFANDLGALPSESDVREHYSVAGWDDFRTLGHRHKSLFTQIIGIYPRLKRRVKSRRLPDGTTLWKTMGADSHYLSGGHHRDVEAVFSDIIESAVEHDTKLVLLLLPSKESAYKPEYVRHFGSDYLRNEEVGYQRLCRLAEANGVGCVDLTGVFRERVTQGASPYFSMDPHWNRSGHRLAAERILPSVRTAIRGEQVRSRTLRAGR
jgi:hypothetical protein